MLLYICCLLCPLNMAFWCTLASPPVPLAYTQVSGGYYTLGSVVITTAYHDTLVVTTEGYLRNDTLNITTTTRVAEAICEPGHWCEEGLRHLCEAGSFGEEFGLTRRNCSGSCNPGFLCEAGSVSPEERPCGVRHTIIRVFFVYPLDHHGSIIMGFHKFRFCF